MSNGELGLGLPLGRVVFMENALEINKRSAATVTTISMTDIFVDELGERMKPDYLTTIWKYIQKHGRRECVSMICVIAAQVCF